MNLPRKINKTNKKLEALVDEATKRIKGKIDMYYWKLINYDQYHYDKGKLKDFAVIRVCIYVKKFGFAPMTTLKFELFEETELNNFTKEINNIVINYIQKVCLK